MCCVFINTLGTPRNWSWREPIERRLSSSKDGRSGGWLISGSKVYLVMAAFYWVTLILRSSLLARSQDREATTQTAHQQDQGDFQDLLQTHDCCVLNTWARRGPTARTYIPPSTKDKQPGTQIDFVITRGPMGDQTARKSKPVAAPFVPPRVDEVATALRRLQAGKVMPGRSARCFVGTLLA